MATTTKTATHKLSTSTLVEHASIEKKRWSTAKKIALATGITITIVGASLAGAATTAYGITYKNWSIDNPVLENKISTKVQELSFTKKTTPFIIDKSLKAQKTVEKYKFNASLAAQSSEFIQAFGSNTLEMAMEGQVDGTNKEAPKAYLKTSIHNQVEFEMLMLDENEAFVKVGKVPEFIYAFLPVPKTEVEVFLNKWISFDTTPLNTEAKKYMTDNVNSPSTASELFEKIVREPQIMSRIVQDSTKTENEQEYVLTFDADPGMVDYLGEKIKKEINANKGVSSSMKYYTTDDRKLSEFVTRLKMDVHVSKTDYTITKVAGLATFIDPQLAGVGEKEGSILPSAQETSLTFVIKITDQGKEFEYSKPESAMSSEEFYQKANTVFYKYQ